MIMADWSLVRRRLTTGTGAHRVYGLLHCLLCLLNASLLAHLIAFLTCLRQARVQFEQNRSLV